MQNWDVLDSARAKSYSAVSPQNYILRKLMHDPLLTFNELWDKRGPSNKFAYHVHALEKKGLVIKRDHSYQLTPHGKKEVAYIKSNTGKRLQAPIVAVAIIVRKGKTYLMQRRMQEPFYGYCGFPSSKITSEQYIYECAREALLE